jgi:hypothetical protein
MPEMTNAYDYNGRTMIGADGEKVTDEREVAEEVRQERIETEGVEQRHG